MAPVTRIPMLLRVAGSKCMGPSSSPASNWQRTNEGLCRRPQISLGLDSSVQLADRTRSQHR